MNLLKKVSAVAKKVLILALRARPKFEFLPPFFDRFRLQNSLGVGGQKGAPADWLAGGQVGGGREVVLAYCRLLEIRLREHSFGPAPPYLILQLNPTPN